MVSSTALSRKASHPGYCTHPRAWHHTNFHRHCPHHYRISFLRQKEMRRKSLVPGPGGKSFFSAGIRELTDTRLEKEEYAAADHMLLIGRTW
jgi:hypothetical protein